jgi:hypothetical protein
MFMESSTFTPASWHGAAIHVLVGIPEFQSVEAISSRLRLAPNLVLETLSKLEAMGLVKSKGRNWTRLPGHLHLGDKSPMVGVHHSEWRQKALESTRHSETDGLHYTLVQSHSF